MLNRVMKEAQRHAVVTIDRDIDLQIDIKFDLYIYIVG